MGSVFPFNARISGVINGALLLTAAILSTKLTTVVCSSLIGFK